MRPAAVQATAYRGRRKRDRTVIVVAYDLASGWEAPLAHIVKHSPAGFEWGYGGSGPAELARCLLLDVLGPAGAACPECAGSERVYWADARPGSLDEAFEPYDPVRHADADLDQIGPCYCDGGYRAVPYQDFKFQVVAGWPSAGWKITRAEVLRWWIARYPEEPPEWLQAAGITDIELPR